MRRYLVGASLLLITSAVSAEQIVSFFETGNALFEELKIYNKVYVTNAGRGTAEDLQDANRAIGYVTGAADVFSTAHSACYPSNLDSFQLVDLTYQYLSEHPESRHELAASLVFSAITKAFPCSERKH